MNFPLSWKEDLLEPTWTEGSPRKQSILWKKNDVLGATSSMGMCERSAESKAWNIEKFLLLRSKLEKRANSAAGWCFFSHFSLYTYVLEGKEGQGAPGLASPLPRFLLSMGKNWIRWNRRFGRSKPRVVMNSGSSARLSCLPFLEDFVNQLFESLLRRVGAFLQTHASHARYSFSKATRFCAHYCSVFVKICLISTEFLDATGLL